MLNTKTADKVKYYIEHLKGKSNIFMSVAYKKIN